MRPLAIRPHLRVAYAYMEVNNQLRNFLACTKRLGKRVMKAGHRIPVPDNNNADGKRFLSFVEAVHSGGKVSGAGKKQLVQCTVFCQHPICWNAFLKKQTLKSQYLVGNMHVF